MDGEGGVVDGDDGGSDEIILEEFFVSYKE